MSERIYIIGVGNEGMEMGVDITDVVSNEAQRKAALYKLKHGETPDGDRKIGQTLFAMSLRARMNGHRCIDLYMMPTEENITLDDLYELFSRENLENTRYILEEKAERVEI